MAIRFCQKYKWERENQRSLSKLSNHAPNLTLHLVVCCKTVTICLRLRDIHVPSVSVFGSWTRLNCSFDLEGDDLYSVKWFKERRGRNRIINGDVGQTTTPSSLSSSSQSSIRWDEFYRFLPKNDPRSQVYPTPGIHVDVSPSFRCSLSVSSVTSLTLMSQFSSSDV